MCLNPHVLFDGDICICPVTSNDYVVPTQKDLSVQVSGGLNAWHSQIFYGHLLEYQYTGKKDLTFTGQRISHWIRSM